MKLKVLYEDNHIIAIHKPAGIIVQSDYQSDYCLMTEVKEYLRQKYHKPGKVFLGMVHRLDREVSGIILFAKTSKGASRLSEQIRNHQITKKYRALVEGVVKKDQKALTHFLLKDKRKNLVSIVPPHTPYALLAKLEYRVIKRFTDRTLLEINLITGRSHQIRVQLASIGHPILGDRKYGSRQKYRLETIALCASKISFQLTTSDEIKNLFLKPDFE